MSSPTGRLCAIFVFALLFALTCAVNDAPMPCTPGTFSASGMKPCIDCPAGSFSAESGATACCECCAGFYSNSASANCNQCPASRPFSNPGSTMQSDCTTGTGFVTSCDEGPNFVCPSVTPSPSPSSRRKRNEPRHQICAKGHKNCPIYGMSGLGGYLRGYECVDIQNDLESCGGCVSNGSSLGKRAEDGGRDCSAIPNVDFVSCRRGRCIIESCSVGYALSEDGEDCVSIRNVVSLQMNGV